MLLRSYTNKDIFADLSDISLVTLVNKHLSQNEQFKSFPQEPLETLDYIDRPERYDDYSEDGEFEDFDVRRYSTFNSRYKPGFVGLLWDEGYFPPNAVGSVEIFLPYSDIEPFLTPVGKEIFK